LQTAHKAHAFKSGTIAVAADGELDVLLGRGAESAAADSLENSLEESALDECDTRSRAAAVMLHLRFCYVSKAAILTVPVQSVPTENRSPA
jgi:hypothetical protein